MRGSKSKFQLFRQKGVAHFLPDFFEKKAVAVADLEPPEKAQVRGITFGEKLDFLGKPLNKEKWGLVPKKE